MRTTLTLDDDVAAALDALRRREGLGLSEAVNRLIREALTRPPAARTYVHRSHELGIKVDVTNIGEVLELLDEDR